MLCIDALKLLKITITDNWKMFMKLHYVNTGTFGTQIDPIFQDATADSTLFITSTLSDLEWWTAKLQSEADQGKQIKFSLRIQLLQL